MKGLKEQQTRNETQFMQFYDIHANEKTENFIYKFTI